MKMGGILAAIRSTSHIILAKEFGLQLFERLGNKDIPNQVWMVERKPSDILHVT